MSVEEARSPSSPLAARDQAAEAAVDLALDLAEGPADSAVARLLESVGFSYPIVSRGRGVCLTRLSERPSNTSALFRALDIFSIALEDLEAGR